MLVVKKNEWGSWGGFFSWILDHVSIFGDSYHCVVWLRGRSYIWWYQILFLLPGWQEKLRKIRSAYCYHDTWTRHRILWCYLIHCNLDRVAVHHVAVGAMYNHSFVTYREPALLYNDQHSTVDNKQRLAVVGTWMVHHWFSYLVPIKCGHKFVAEWRFGKLMCFWAMGWLLQWCKILINFWKGT